MDLIIKFSKTIPKTCEALAAFTSDKKKLPDAVGALDKELKGFISEALKTVSSYSGKPREVFSCVLPKNSLATHLVVQGAPDAKEATTLEIEKAGARIWKALLALKSSEIALVPDHKSSLSEAVIAAHLAHGVKLCSYSFEKYRPAAADAEKTPGKVTLTIVTPAATEAKKLYEALSAVESGVVLARNLVNEAPNVLYPESYAALIKAELEPLGVKVDVLDEKKMDKLGMGAILAVGMGSARPPRMVIMRWNGSGKKDEKPLGFVGKGVTFDTGGISLKPGAGMDAMKMDMGGSAAVVGLMKAVAVQKLKRDVVGIVGLAENMPSDRAYRPGDMVKSYQGKYIEVLNTDAEGRLVLVDCLSYLQEKFDPALIVDLATLTGAIRVALAHEYSGVFVNDDKLWKALEAAGTATGEKVWRMPLDEAYRKDVESDIGAVRNLAKNDRLGGACTAAAFLEHFIDEKRIWAHMDIAGTAFLKTDHPLGPKGATGVGVRLLDALVKSYGA